MRSWWYNFVRLVYRVVRFWLYVNVYFVFGCGPFVLAYANRPAFLSLYAASLPFLVILIHFVDSNL